MKKKIILLLLLVTALSLFAQQQGGERFIRVINLMVDAIKAVDYTALVREYNNEMLKALPLDRTTIFFKNLELQYGKVQRVDPPQIVAPDEANFIMYFERSTQDLKLYLDDQGKIKGFLFTTRATPEPTPVPPQTSPQTPPLELKPIAPVVADKQQTQLFLPFKGNWVVLSGGEFREGSPQHNLLLQQYAYEFSAKDANGERYKNDGKTNEDYFGYGKEVLAPADGTIVEAIDGVRENSPGLRNPYALVGNAVVIQHSLKEYSVLAYLKQGSVRVKLGDRVTRGQVIALCGNSGNASEPALHFHLQDSPFLQTAKGLKFYFERTNVSKEGLTELRSNYLPEMGNVLSPE
jgi:hypothetical protein